MDDADYKMLLGRYMAEVEEIASTDFVDAIDTHLFTQEELETLYKLSAQNKEDY